MLLYMLNLIYSNDKTALSFLGRAVLVVMMYKLNNVFNNNFKDIYFIYL
jgi:hypothetical protein